ncbi:MAG: diguanylate cyclase [Candidatus Sedimenticola sp. (ex Thyasira tokunagai)]
MQQGRLSLKATITIPFIALIAATVAMVGYLSFITGSDAVNEVADEVRQNAYSQVLHHLEGFLEAPHQVNRLNKNYIDMSGMDLGDPIALQNYFWQQLQIFETTNYIYFGNNAGGILLVARRGDGSYVARQTDEFAAGKSTVYLMTDSGTRSEALQRREAYDSRERPWYKKATADGGAIWTDIYTFFLEGTLGITAALPLYSSAGELSGVLATDILLSRIQKQLAELTKGDVGEIFIFEPSGLLVASSSDLRPFRGGKEGKKITRIDAGDSISPLIRTAYHELTQQFTYFKMVNQEHHLEFDFEGQRQFLQLSPFRDPRGINWLIAIAVPEAPFMERVVKNTYITVGLCLIALLIAGILSFYLARRVTVPLSNLKQAALSFTAGNWGQQIPDDGSEEISSLANSFNVMAQQLQGSFSRLRSNNRKLEDTQAALRQVNSELTQRVEAQSSELGESEERYKRLAEATFECVVLHTGSIILDVNKAFEETLGYSAEEVKGKALLEFALPEHRGLLERALISEQSTPFQAAIAHKNGESVILKLRTTRLPLHGEEVKVTVMRDTDDHKGDRNRSGTADVTDPLTGLNNMRRLQELAASELRRAQRFDRPFIILLLDIDRLQEINETYGYSMGDEAAHTVAKICSSQLRDIDIIGRIQGGEFAAVLPETDRNTALKVAKRLRDAVDATSVHYKGYSLRITISIGLTLMKRSDEPFEEVFQRADQALYRAKEGGGILDI